MEIISKNWEHYNRALGKQIRSKRHYFEELRKGGYVSQEEGNRLAESNRSKSQKAYTLDSKTDEFLRHIKQTTDSNGNVKLSDRAIDKLVEMGAIAKKSDVAKLERKEVKGGFN